MRLPSLAVLATSAAAVLSHGASAQQDTLAAPQSLFGSYDPTMSAKEAVLANWELAASGCWPARW